jgi:holin-like protein
MACRLPRPFLLPVGGAQHLGTTVGAITMIHSLTVILLCQLVGEVVSRALAIPVPGPVIGMLLLVGLFIASPKVAALVRPTADGILRHLSLLFVPAGVGVVGHLNTLGDQGVSVALALVGSTVASIAVGAFVFVAVAKLTERPDA